MDFGASGWLISQRGSEVVSPGRLILDVGAWGLFGTVTHAVGSGPRWMGPLSAQLRIEEFFTRIDDENI